MAEIKLLQKLANTAFNDNSKGLLSRIIRKEFDATDDEEKAFELLQIAWKYQLPALDLMLNDYSITDFKIF